MAPSPSPSHTLLVHPTDAHEHDSLSIEDASDDWVSLLLSDTSLDEQADPLPSLASFPLPDLEDIEFANIDGPASMASASCHHTTSNFPDSSFDDLLCSFEEEASSSAMNPNLSFDLTGTSLVRHCTALSQSPTYPTGFCISDPSSTTLGLNASLISDACLHGTQFFGAAQNSANPVSECSPSPESGLTQGSYELQDTNILEGDASGSEEDKILSLVNDVCSEGTGSTEHGNHNVSSTDGGSVPEFKGFHAGNGQQHFPCVSDSGVQSPSFDKVSRKRKAVDGKSRSAAWEETGADSFERTNDETVGGEDEKRHARLMRNRESAQLSRQRKKLYVDELEEKVKTMASTIAELNNTINLISAENINLRRQLGFFGPPPTQPGGIPVNAPWVGPYPGPMMGGRFMVPGSQVPLVPIPRWRSQQTTNKKTKSKAESQAKGFEAKASKRTKKVAGVAVVGLLFMFLLLPFNLNFLGLNPTLNEEAKAWPVSTWRSHSGNAVIRAGGRVLTAISEDENSTQDDPSTRWSSSGIGSEVVEADSQTGRVPEPWRTLAGCHSGDQDTGLHNDSVYASNGSAPLAATLFVPRNDRLVRIEGNLIIHSVLAGDKAAIESINLHRGREELKSNGKRMQELNHRGLALDANLKAVALKVDPHEKGALVDLQKALAAKSHSDGGGMHSVHEDGSLQQWFIDSLAGPIFSSGMCTEVFQFETSVAASTTSSTSSSNEHETSNFLKNGTEKISEQGPRRAGRWVSSSRKGASYAVPLPPARDEAALDRDSKKRNVTGSSDRIRTEETFKNQKHPSSSMVVSVLAGDQARLSGGSMGLSRIFVVVLVDSVKYVTYSCMLPSTGSQTSL